MKQACNERNQTKRVEIEGIRTSTDTDSALDETEPSFLLLKLNWGM
ncbi:hypothetical protein [Veillonella sp. R32]|nr:hypothetical protein [Veillonella sp. R32]